MPKYMDYGGRAVDIYGYADGQEVPRLLLSDVGEKVGDYAFIDDQPVEWDGERWIWSPWQTLSGHEGNVDDVP